MIDLTMSNPPLPLPASREGLGVGINLLQNLANGADDAVGKDIDAEFAFDAHGELGQIEGVKTGVLPQIHLRL